MLPILQDIDKLRPYVATVPAPSRYPHDKDGEDFVISSPSAGFCFKQKYNLDYVEVEMLQVSHGISHSIPPYLSATLNAEQIEALLARGSLTTPIPTSGSASPASRGFKLCPWSDWHQRCTTLGCYLPCPSRTGYPVRLPACLRLAVVHGSLRLTRLMVAQGPGYDLGQAKPAEESSPPFTAPRSRSSCTRG